MKNYNLKITNLLCSMALFIGQYTFAQNTPTCEDFNNSTGAWQTAAAGISISNAGTTANGTSYMRGTDGASRIGSWIYNTSYNATSINGCSSQICFDYNVFNDGDPGSPDITPQIRIYSGNIAIANGVTASAVFVAENSKITENDDWINICVPIKKSRGGMLPSNPQGHWVMGGNATAADWDNLIDNFDGVAFITDVAGSSLQSEVIGIDNFCVTKSVEPVASLGIQDLNGNSKTMFGCGEDVFLNGIASQNENHYYIDIWRRPIGSTGAFQWQSALGWTHNQQVGVLNLTDLFAAKNYMLQDGYEYEVKLALSNECNGWVPVTGRFSIKEISVSSDFKYEAHCAEDGTITVVVTALDANPSQWWRLFESSAAGSTTDAATIGTVSPIQGGTSVTYTGLSRSKNYYVKHGVWNDCTPWMETRKALPNTIGWNNYTTDFAISAFNDFQGNVTVSVMADSNPVNVHHWWGVFYDGTNTMVSGNGIQCCQSDTATFNTNLQVNTWYYIKHGIWNDCLGWGEKRTAFRIQINGRSREYFVETKEIQFRPSREYLAEMNRRIATGEIAELGAYEVFEDHLILSSEAKEVILYPNPAKASTTVSIQNIDSNTVKEVTVMSLSGKKTRAHTVKNRDSISIQLNETKEKGVHFVQITLNNGQTVTKRLVIE